MRKVCVKIAGESTAGERIAPPRTCGVRISGARPKMWFIPAEKVAVKCTNRIQDERRQDVGVDDVRRETLNASIIEQMLRLGLGHFPFPLHYALRSFSGPSRFSNNPVPISSVPLFWTTQIRYSELHEFNRKILYEVLSKKGQSS